MFFLAPLGLPAGLIVVGDPLGVVLCSLKALVMKAAFVAVTTAAEAARNFRRAFSFFIFVCARVILRPGGGEEEEEEEEEEGETKLRSQG